jgi:hypothetical protein
VKIGVEKAVIKQLLDCWLEVSIPKVLRLSDSARGFLCFLMSKSECSDGSHVALKN